MKYLILCNRHNSIYGENWCLFWGFRECEGGYTSDLRVAHRFDEEDIKNRVKIGNLVEGRDIPIPIDVLGISEEYESEEEINKSYLALVEKGTMNELLNLKLKPLNQ